MGLDFKKGCYPGQEIVARSQYLGTIKRRLMIGFVPLNSSDMDNLKPGTPVYLLDDPEHEIGRIVLTAYSTAQNGFVFQFEILLSYLDSKLVIQNKDQEYVLIRDIQSPPYPLLEI
jgi:folate-binding Fe-S cluster repair protein YgfZ